MSGGLWFVAGAGAGIYAVIRGRRAAEAFTVDGLTDRLNAAAVGARLFRDEVAQGRAEKESELRERLAVAAPGSPSRPALAATPAHPTAHPTSTPAPPADQEEGTT